MLHAEGACTYEEPVHRRAVECPGPAETVGLREACQQLEVNLAGQTSERAVADAVEGLVPHPGLQVVCDQTNHLASHVIAVERVQVQPIEKTLGGRDAGLFMVV